MQYNSSKFEFEFAIVGYKEERSLLWRRRIQEYLGEITNAG